MMLLEVWLVFVSLKLPGSQSILSVWKLLSSFRRGSSHSYLLLPSSPFPLEMSIRQMLGIWNSSSSDFSLISILCFIFLPCILGDFLAFTCDIIIKSNELLSSKITLEDESTLPCGPDDHGIKKASHTPLPCCGWQIKLGHSQPAMRSQATWPGYFNMMSCGVTPEGERL